MGWPKITLSEATKERLAGGGVPVDVTIWLKEHEGRGASATLRIWGLDGDYSDFTAWSEDGAIRVEPLPA